MRKSVFLFFGTVIGSFSFAQVALAQEATLAFTPSSGTIPQKETFWVAVMVDTKAEQAREVTVSFSYPQDLLEPAGIDTSGSVLRLFSEQSGGGGVAAKGKVSIAGKPFPPGFSGIHKIASVGFRAKKSSGTALLAFLPDSTIVRSEDGQNILQYNLLKNGAYVLQSSPPQSLPSAAPSAPNQTPLLISNPVIEEAGEGEFVISWETNRKADSRLEYGVTSESAVSVFNSELTTSHRVHIPKTILSDAYYFRIKSASPEGLQADTGELRIADFLKAIAQSSSKEEHTKQAESEKSSLFSLGIFLSVLILLAIGILFLLYKLRNRLETW